MANCAATQRTLIELFFISPYRFPLNERGFFMSAYTGNHRRSVRLRGYDYASTGMYFVTICAHDRGEIFGHIVGVDGVGASGRSPLQLNAFGMIVEDEWIKSAKIRREIVLDQYIIMPDHMHGIVIINNDGLGRGEQPLAPTMITPGMKSKSIGAMVAGFKSIVTKRINGLRNTPGVPVWQRNYYEHIIRDERDLNCIREYISNNPMRG